MATRESITTQVAPSYDALPTMRWSGLVARSRAVAAHIAWGAALCVLFGVTAELACRVEDRLRFGMPLFTPITSQADLMVRDAAGVHGRPNTRFEKWRMNALGTSGPAAALLKPDSTARVVVAGASETFGLYESPDKEYPRQLEDSLNHLIAVRRCPIRRFEVLNAALPGMSLPTIEQDLRNRVRRFGADVIVLYSGPVAYLVDEPPQPATPDSSGRVAALSWTRSLHPRFFDRLRSQLKELLPDFAATWLRRRQTESELRTKPPGWRFATLPLDRLELYESDLRTVIGTIRRSGAIPILTTHANRFMRPSTPDRGMLVAWEKFYPRAPGNVILAFDAAANAITLRVASDSAVPIVDLARIVATTGEKDLFADFAHFTDRGAGVVAGALLRPVLATTLRGKDCGDE